VKTREQIDECWTHILRIPSSQRDGQLLQQLQEDYATPAARWLVNRKMGLGLSREDIDEVVSDACQALWNHFDVGRGQRPSAYFHTVVENGARDRLRQYVSRKGSLIRGSVPLTPEILATSPDDGDHKNPHDKVEDKELFGAIDVAKSRCTPREKLAFEARFSGRVSNNWSEELVRKHGKDSHYWRKASDDALIRIKTFLKSHGFMPDSQEGDTRAAL
jgi:DNA-directed RNA polymerase specialized sigma24 family protein